MIADEGILFSQVFAQALEMLTIIEELSCNKGLVVWLCYITWPLSIRKVKFVITCYLTLLILRPMSERLLDTRAGEYRLGDSFSELWLFCLLIMERYIACILSDR